jgi:hypothetical protein
MTETWFGEPSRQIVSLDLAFSHFPGTDGNFELPRVNKMLENDLNHKNLSHKHMSAVSTSLSFCRRLPQLANAMHEWDRQARFANFRSE